MCVVGARPNYMKMAPLIRAFRSDPAAPPTLLVHTGQHYDVAMNDRLFADLKLRAPDVNLDVGSATPRATDRGDHAPLRACRRRCAAKLRGRRRGRELDAGVQPGMREEGDSGRACRGGTAQFRSHDAGRNQSPAHRSDLRRALHDRAFRRREPAPRRYLDGTGPFRGQCHDRLAAGEPSLCRPA